MAKKETKKEKKPVKPVTVRKVGEVVNMEAKVRLVSFTLGATIPTQSFGNIQPQIVVEAPTYEMARDYAVEKIEEFYKKYAEIKPEFLGKVTVEEKVVTQEKTPAPVMPEETGGPVPVPQKYTAPATAVNPEPLETDSEAVKRAKKAIKLAATYEAAKAIEDQIIKSVKIKPEEKPPLFELTLKRAKELK